ncbi:MAG TPA: GNAT family N-acetyltransferase [Caulobacteraceae bacterium]|jgi:aminoglycoside 6'-N-acetyltransferase I|nr:GNAT family N-acetyltransferase [Caulobacteraceae bacterium]
MRAGGRYGLEIRSALPADATFLAELFTGAGAAISASELANRLAVLRASPGAVLMASDWGPAIGMVAVQWAPSLLAAQPIARVSALLVAPDARRRGVARALLKAASQAARSAGCGELEFSIPENATDLLAFVVATGFTPLGAVLTRRLRKGRA